MIDIIWPVADYHHVLITVLSMAMLRTHMLCFAKSVIRYLLAFADNDSVPVIYLFF